MQPVVGHSCVDRLTQTAQVGLAFAMVTGVSLASSAATGLVLDHLKHKQLVFAVASAFNAITNGLLLVMKGKAGVVAFAICYGTYIGMTNAGWLGALCPLWHPRASLSRGALALAANECVVRFCGGMAAARHWQGPHLSGPLPQG